MISKGFIAIDKPKGWTSFDVVNKIKYMVKPLKVGHLGTLDPMATGVMIVCVGKATKLFDFMQEKLKTYVAEFEFGYETDSLDSTGEKLKVCDKIPSIDEIKKAIETQIGKINQIPPKFSAKMVNGKRAYDLARKGKEFELKPKLVYIKRISILSYSKKVLKLEIECGSGTYIRSIGRDIAYACNSLATMTSLIRTKVDSFELKNCRKIEDLNSENIFSNFLNIEEVIKLPNVDLTEEEINKLLNGQKLSLTKEDGFYLLKHDENVVAMVEIKNNVAKMSIFLA